MFADFKDLLGQTIVRIDYLQVDSSHVVFHCRDGTKFFLYHVQDCCEAVYIADIVGNAADLLNSPITMADEVVDANYHDPRNESLGSYTWTFYKLATIKGYVDIRWLGESNGYYSEHVYFARE